MFLTLLGDDSHKSGSDANGIVVLGMGRSGTSSVTRMFVRCGFFAGEKNDIMGASEPNPTGHWENLSVWRANEELLEKLGASWFDPPTAAAQMAARSWADRRLRGEIESLISQASGAPIAIKDPRIGVLMTLWDPIIQDHLHPILVIRDPVEIARSISRRDGTPIPFALSAWELHMTMLLEHLRGQLVTVAPYKFLLSEHHLPQLIVEAAAANIDPTLTRRLRAAEAPSAFEQTLYRNRANDNEHREQLTSYQLELWSFLSGLPAGSQRIDAPPSLSTLTTATARATVSLETARVAKEGERAKLAQALTSEGQRSCELERSLAETRKHRDELAGELRCERERADANADSHIRAEQWLGSIQGSLSWRITRPLRAFKRVIRMSKRG